MPQTESTVDRNACWEAITAYPDLAPAEYQRHVTECMDRFGIPKAERRALRDEARQNRAMVREDLAAENLEAAAW